MACFPDLLKPEDASDSTHERKVIVAAKRVRNINGGSGITAWFYDSKNLRGAYEMQIKRIVIAGLALLAASAMAITGPNPAGGTVSGTVKLDGTPPHMKGIDMSKDPYCVKFIRTDRRYAWKMWLSAKGEDWRTWFSTFLRD
jgi:hypothetical protein